MINALFCGLLWAALRRWYGGWGEDKPIIGSRGVQSVVMILCLIPLMLNPFWKQYSVWLMVGVSIISALWIQFQFWSRAIGNIIDSGRNHNQAKENYDRWYRIPLDLAYNTINKILKRIGSNKQLVLYQGNYDFFYTMMRYSCPMLVFVYASWWYVFVGILSAPCYYLSWHLFEKHSVMWKLPEVIGQPKNLAEVMYGFVFGVGMTLISMLL